MDTYTVKTLADRLQQQVGQVIVGKDHEIQLLLTALFASGHVLMEDVPGTGKTMLAKTLAAAMSCHFQRIQFTPDLLPSDLTGIHFFNQKESEFTFRAGPLFANIVLADEINRATPRTQSSLLECMEEQQISVDGETMKLDNPFMVIATQNPVDNQGTFPLPEAQMDRFMLKMSMGYPSAEEGIEILRRTSLTSQASKETTTDSNSSSVFEQVTREQIIEARQLCQAVTIHEDLLGYIVRLAEATREHEEIALGASPRATQALLRAAQAYAAIQGRDYVLPDDIQTMASPVLAHRLVFKNRHHNDKHKAHLLIQSILDTEQVPTEANLESRVK